MRYLIIILAISLASVLNATAKYDEKMLAEQIKQLNKAKTEEKLVSLVKSFENISKESPNQWLPIYYASYANLSVLFFSNNLTPTEKKEYLSKAQKQLNVALTIDDKESELHVLQAFIYLMSINAPEEGYDLSNKAIQSLQKAKALNPNNPRIYYLEATNEFYKPTEFGGGKAAAKPILEKANRLFETQSHENTLLPQWGQQHNRVLLSQCD